MEEQADGSGLPAKRGLSYTLTLTASPLVIVAFSLIISKSAVSNPNPASVVYCTSPLTINSKDFPPDP